MAVTLVYFLHIQTTSDFTSLFPIFHDFYSLRCLIELLNLGVILFGEIYSLFDTHSWQISATSPFFSINPRPNFRHVKISYFFEHKCDRPYTFLDYFDPSSHDSKFKSHATQNFKQTFHSRVFTFFKNQHPNYYAYTKSHSPKDGQLQCFVFNLNHSNNVIGQFWQW